MHIDFMCVCACVLVYVRKYPSCILLHIIIRVCTLYVACCPWVRPVQKLGMPVCLGMYACMHVLVHCACALDASQHLRCYSLYVYVPMYLLRVSILWRVCELYASSVDVRVKACNHFLASYSIASEGIELRCIVLYWWCLVLYCPALPCTPCIWWHWIGLH